jgi:hypothetical protein
MAPKVTMVFACELCALLFFKAWIAISKDADVAILKLRTGSNTQRVKYAILIPLGTLFWRSLRFCGCVAGTQFLNVMHLLD